MKMGSVMGIDTPSRSFRQIMFLMVEDLTVQSFGRYNVTLLSDFLRFDMHVRSVGPIQVILTCETKLQTIIVHLNYDL